MGNRLARLNQFLNGLVQQLAVQALHPALYFAAVLLQRPAPIPPRGLWNPLQQPPRPLCQPVGCHLAGGPGRGWQIPDPGHRRAKRQRKLHCAKHRALGQQLVQAAAEVLAYRVLLPRRKAQQAAAPARLECHQRFAAHTAQLTLENRGCLFLDNRHGSGGKAAGRNVNF